MESDRLKIRLKDKARSLGLDAIGVATPDRTRHGAFYRRWLERGHHGGMAYLARKEAAERRQDLRRTVPSVRSVVVAADHYPAQDGPGIPEDPSRGVIARYARGRDYHRVLSAKLRGLARWLDDAAGRGHEHRVYVDTGPILERDLARRAGLGWFGRNTMLIHPRRGSYFFLGVLLTTVELEADTPFEVDHCGSCSACLEACPTGALLGRDENGGPVMDARRCISYLTIEHRGPIPEELRPLMGNRVFGCDICQEVCPWNSKFAAEADEPGYAARGPGELPTGVERLPGERVAMAGGEGVTEVRGGAVPAHPGTRAPSLVGLMRMTREEWDGFSRGSAIRRAGYAGFRRNLAVAMGNWLATVEGAPPEEAVAVLQDALEDESELVREHARWALERVRAS